MIVHGQKIPRGNIEKRGDWFKVNMNLPLPQLASETVISYYEDGQYHFEKYLVVEYAEVGNWGWVRLRKVKETSVELWRVYDTVDKEYYHSSINPFGMYHTIEGAEAIVKYCREVSFLAHADYRGGVDRYIIEKWEMRSSD